MSLLTDFFTDLGVRGFLVAAVDVLVVYYVLYRVLLTIKGTRAAQMVIGIVLIGAAFYAAQRFEMVTVLWLLDNFIEYFIIIVIVVFQQDIRRALMQLGANISRFGRRHEMLHALDEILAAAESLAKARIGGIVVFEREVGLKEFIDHGKPIDAKVSKELLVSLFVPSRDNVLHDGAVVVKDLRLSSAGAVLPLSRSMMASNFGTRHRAALGITEETDAAALVVSEERGEISLCIRGHIARDMEIDTLREALEGLFRGEREASAIEKEAEAAAEIGKAMAAMAGDSDKSTEESAVKASLRKTTGIKESLPRSQTGLTTHET